MARKILIGRVKFKMCDKIKVVWICHFSNDKIRSKLPLSKRLNYRDYAPWVSNLIKEFEKLDNIDLHIIAPHSGLLKAIYSFDIGKVNYHFYKPDLPIIHKRIPEKVYSFFPINFAYPINRYFINSFISKIKPDIVNLIGAENLYYSTSVLDIKNIPVYLSCQTVYSNPLRKIHSNELIQYIWDSEVKIHKKIKYIGCGGRMHYDLVLKNNSDAIVFKMFFPLQKPINIKQQAKTIDFIFFAAGVTKKKGIEDAIDALAIVKKQYENITLNIVGIVNVKYKRYLLEKIRSNKLEENVTFQAYFTTHADMHQYITSAKFALLPVKLDIIPGTILEAIFLDLPVITCKTTGTPFLNKNNQSVLISEIDDINGLANNMIRIIESPTLALSLKGNAKRFIEKEFDNTTSALRLINNYEAVINHYYNNTPIPKEQIFSTKEFPIY